MSKHCIAFYLFVISIKKSVFRNRSIGFSTSATLHSAIDYKFTFSFFSVSLLHSAIDHIALLWQQFVTPHFHIFGFTFHIILDVVYKVKDGETWGKNVFSFLFNVRFASCEVLLVFPIILDFFMCQFCLMIYDCNDPTLAGWLD